MKMTKELETKIQKILASRDDMPLIIKSILKKSKPWLLLRKFSMSCT